MCLMCIEIAKERMTPDEAKRALPELISFEKSEKLLKHYEELQKANETEIKEIAKRELARSTDRQ